MKNKMAAVFSSVGLIWACLLAFPAMAANNSDTKDDSEKGTVEQIDKIFGGHLKETAPETEVSGTPKSNDADNEPVLKSHIIIQEKRKHDSLVAHDGCLSGDIYFSMSNNPSRSIHAATLTAQDKLLGALTGHQWSLVADTNNSQHFRLAKGVSLCNYSNKDKTYLLKLDTRNAMGEGSVSYERTLTLTANSANVIEVTNTENIYCLLSNTKIDNIKTEFFYKGQTCNKDNIRCSISTEFFTPEIGKLIKPTVSVNVDEKTETYDINLFVLSAEQRIIAESQGCQMVIENSNITDVTH